MDCPICKQLLHSQTLHGFSLYRCQICQGELISNTQLGPYLNFLATQPHISHHKIDLDHQPLTTQMSSEQTKTCSQCSTPMRIFNYRYDSNIFLNKCPNCNNIWLDGNEIEPLATIVKGNPTLRDLGRVIAEEEAKRDETPKSIQAIIAASRPIPFGDDEPRNRFPIVTCLIILICVLVFIYQNTVVSDVRAFFRIYGFIPNFFSPIALFTTLYLHGDIAHLLSNMFYLWIFGDNVEEKFGHGLFFVMYTLFGFTASILAALLGPETHYYSVHIGASGAISGILGSYFIMYPNAKIKTLWLVQFIHVNARLFLGFWFVGQLINSIAKQNSLIGWTTHMFGFLAGCGIAYLFVKLKHQPINYPFEFTHSDPQP